MAESGERRLRIADDHLGQSRFDGCLDERGRGAPLHRRGNECMPVEALAPQRDEELAALDRARVDRDAGEFHVLAGDAPARRRDDVREPPLHWALPACSRTHSRSLNDRRSPPTIW